MHAITGKFLLCALAGSMIVSARSAELPCVNSQNDRTTREDIFEFTQKPMVTKQGNHWVIAFASKGKCDATVAVVDPSGKIVRHLASGVLGKNAPWPFKQDSLSQSLEWDGKDDAGNPVSPGSAVKVSLGLAPILDKYFSKPKGAEAGSGCCGLATDKSGNLYVVRNANVMRYTREGKYDRQIFPPPADLATPEKFSPVAIDWQETIWGDKVMVDQDPRAHFKFFCSASFGSDQPIGAPAIGPDGQIAFVYESDHNLGHFHRIDKDGSMPTGSSMTLAGINPDRQHIAPWNRKDVGAGSHHMATSPDGQWLYISAIGHAVGRVKWADYKGPVLNVEIFKGELAKGGNDNDHFDLPAGIACDDAGNVLIADPENNRIQVYKPDGGYLATVAVNHPQRIEVHPKTGAIYALCWDVAKSGECVLRKLSGWKNTKEVASLSVRAYINYAPWARNSMALDAGTEPAGIWLWGAAGLSKVVDKGREFANVELPSEKADPTLLCSAGENMPRIIADPAREEVYLGDGCVYYGKPFVRANGRTGKIDPTFSKKGVDLAIGPDGLIYMRTGHAGMFVVRYDHAGKPVPFAKGLKISLSEDGSAGAVKQGQSQPNDYTAIYVASGCNSKIWQPGFTIASNGDIWVWANEQSNAFINAMFDSQGNPITPEAVAKVDFEKIVALPYTSEPISPAIQKNPNGESSASKSLVMVWDKDGNLKCPEAISNTTKGQVLRLDLQGHLYLLNQFDFDDRKSEPMECIKGGMTAGMLVKIASKGSLPIARVLPKDTKPAMPGLKNLTHRGFPIEGVTWAVPNADNVFTGCQCHMFYFDLDRFGRSFLPVGSIYSVLVYDTNGNFVARIGGYGNGEHSADAKQPVPVEFLEPRTVGVSDEAMYVADKHVCRVKFAYRTEASVPVP